MKERPILFASSMVRAILDGSKTQTRRVVKPQPEWVNENAGCGIATGGGIMPSPRNDWLHWRGSRLLRPEPRCPYGLPGDRLWVRETWAAFDGNAVLYAADKMSRVFPVSWTQSAALHGLHERHGNKWRPSIHMPRWASRILLEITGVRVERVQDISEADARAEGVKVDGNGHAVRDEVVNVGGARTAFAELWESINGPDLWAANPWVWVVAFRRVEP